MYTRRTKVILLFLLLCLAGCTTGQQKGTAWSEPGNGLKLGLEASSSSPRVGTTVEFEAHLKNLSDQTLGVVDFDFSRNLSLIILDEKGRQISFMQRHHEGEPLFHALQPDETISTAISLNLTPKEWKGGTGRFKAKAVLDTKKEEETTNPRPETKLWIGSCRSGAIDFEVVK